MCTDGELDDDDATVGLLPIVRIVIGVPSTEHLC